MRLEILFRHSRKEIPQNSHGQISRHAADSADDKIAVSRSAICNGLGYQSMG